MSSTCPGFRCITLGFLSLLIVCLLPTGCGKDARPGEPAPLMISLSWKGLPAPDEGSVEIAAIRIALYDTEEYLVTEGWDDVAADDSFSVRLEEIPPGEGYTVTAEAHGLYHPEDGSSPDSGLVYFASRRHDVSVTANEITRIVLELTPFVPLFHDPILDGDSLRLSWTSLDEADEYYIFKSIGAPVPYRTADTTLTLNWVVERARQDRILFRLQARNSLTQGARGDTLGVESPQTPGAAFVIDSYSPQQGQTISANDSLVITLNRGVDPATLINGQTVYVTAGSEEALINDPVISQNGRRIEIYPQIEWAGGAMHALTLTTGITDSAGMALDGYSPTPDPENFELSFYVDLIPNRAPGTPVLISPDDGTVDLPPVFGFLWRASMDPDGDPVTYDFHATPSIGHPIFREAVADTYVIISLSSYTPGIDFTWYVEAKDPHGAGASSATRSFTLMDTPAIPTDLRALLRSDTRITVGWTDNSTSELGFLLDRKGPADNEFVPQPALDADVTSYEDSGLLPLQTVSYRVRSYNDIGASAPSETLTVRTRPATPSDVSAHWISPERIAVEWSSSFRSALLPADLFLVERSVDGSPFLNARTLSGQSSLWIDNDVNPEQEYAYRLLAIVVSPPDTSAVSETALAQTSIPTPLDFNVEALDTRTVALTWSYQAPSPDSFLVHRRELQTLEFSPLMTVPGMERSAADNSVLPGRAYDYRLLAVAGTDTSFHTPTENVIVPINPPDPISVTGYSPTEIIVSWTYNDPDPLGFLIERRDPGEQSFVQIDDVPGGYDTILDSDLESVSLYAYRIKAYDVADTSAASVIESAYTLTGLPSAPRNLRAEGVSYSIIQLTWDEPDSGSVDSYTIEGILGGEGQWQELGTTGADTLTFVHAGLGWRNYWIYRVIAANNYGPGDPSSQAGARPLLPAPQTLYAESTAPDVIQIQWSYDFNANPEAYDFTVQRAVGEGGSFEDHLANIPGDWRLFADYPLEPATLYTYRVRAEDDYGVSIWSPEASDTTEANAVPGTPTNVNLELLSAYQVRLSWSIGNGGAPEGYEIRKQRMQDSSLLDYDEVSADQEAYIDTVLPARRYRYAVRAYNSSGASAWSETVENWTTGWRKLTPQGDGPELNEAGGAYDEPGDRWVIFGGTDQQLGFAGDFISDDLWSLSFGDSAWTLVDAGGDPPPGAYAMNAASDPADRRFFFIGGRGYSDYWNYRSVWVLDLNTDTWSSLPDQSPTTGTFIEGVLIYRSTPENWYLHGGWSAGFDGQHPTSMEKLIWGGVEFSEWYWVRQDRPYDPVPVSGHCGFYNNNRNRLVVFGGEIGMLTYGTPINTLYTVNVGSDTDSWIAEVTTGDIPPARARHAAAFDADNEILYVFGGLVGNQAFRFNDLYMCPVGTSNPDLYKWTRLGVDLLPQDTPEAREGALMMLDPARARLVLFGGWDGSNALGDVWIYQLGAP
ncbi:MAG: fibronectin type III domain-containing protein [Candidatus Eisenbacteria bacterium]|nr:fibronectin type III domain-containing protein [Candidatus Eisenbacteria bacterium]